MRKTTILATVLALMASPLLADPVHGIWSTAPDDNGNTGHIRVTNCGDTICGSLIRAFDSSGQPMESENVGRAIIWDMQPRGNGEYRNGRVWAPDRDQTYSARMQMRGNQLGVSGCFLVICREAVWTRVE